MSYSAQEYATSFLNHRQPLLELLEKIPDTHSDFTMYNGGLSIVQQLNQLIGFDNSVLEALTQQPQAEPDHSLISSARQQLSSNATQISTLYAALSTALLDSQLEVETQTRTVYQWLEFVREHEIHHKGQLWIAARMLRIEPPYYLKIT